MTDLLAEVVDNCQTPLGVDFVWPLSQQQEEQEQEPPPKSIRRV